MSASQHLAVIIPARNEEQLLPAALSSVSAAVGVLHERHPVRAVVTVVLDSCTDGSADVVSRMQRTWPPGSELRIVAGSFGTVGASRAAGIDALPPLSELWIATTDADTVVPDHWLLHQYTLAAAGYALVLGTAVPDPADLTSEEFSAWQQLHTLAEGHDHIHGANMGFSAQAYHRAGGFAPLPAHEDVDLVTRLKAAGTPWVATDRIRVTTSGRRDGRAPEGFSRFLRQLLAG